LNCSNTKISNLEPIKNLTKIRRLNLAKTEIISLKMIGEFKDIIDLDISNTNVHSLAGIVSKRMKILNIEGTLIHDLYDLAEMDNIEYLYCSRTNISDLEPLTFLNIQNLDCSYTKIKDITPLASGVNRYQLESLNISATSVEDISSIIEYDQLHDLNCNCYYLSEIPEFEGALMNLKYLTVNKNTNIMKFQEKHPDCKITKKF